MSFPELRVPVSTLRDAAHLRRNEAGLRRTAYEIGLSPTGLARFLEGTQPYPHTVAKLTRWYLGRYASRAPVLSADVAHSILDQLVQFLPRPWRVPAIRRMLKTLEAHARDADVPAPEWLTGLQTANDKG